MKKDPLNPRAVGGAESSQTGRRRPPDREPKRAHLRKRWVVRSVEGGPTSITELANQLFGAVPAPGRLYEQGFGLRFGGVGIDVQRAGF